MDVTRFQVYSVRAVATSKATVELQIFVVKYFRDFRELHRNDKNFLPQKFPYSTLKYTDKSQKLAKITKI